MRTSKITVEQISHDLRRVESGVAVAEICRGLEIAGARFLLQLRFVIEAAEKIKAQG